MKRAKAAAKSRRVDPLPRLTLNLEIVGVALLAIAAYVALALWAPKSAGWFGPGLASTIGVWFGAAAWISVAGLVVVATIIFLEIHVVRIMALMAACAAGEFLALDAALGMSSRGGAVGNAIAWGLSHVFGGGGAGIAIVFAIIAFVVAPTGVSMKKTLAAGAVWGAGALARLRSAYGAIVAERAAARPLEFEASKLPANRREPPQPEDVEKAFVVEEPSAGAIAEMVPSENEADAIVERAVPVSPLDPVEKAVASRPARPVATPRTANGDAPVRLAPVGYKLPDFALFNPPEKRAHS